MLLMANSASRYIVVSTHKSKSEETFVPQIKKNVRFIERCFSKRIRATSTEPRKYVAPFFAETPRVMVI